MLRIMNKTIQRDRIGQKSMSSAILLLILVLVPGIFGMQASAQCVADPADIVSWWPGEGNANDSIGTNNGTLMGGASYAPGEVGQAFLFDGSSGYVLIPDSQSLDSFVTNITIELWIFVNQTTPNGDWRGIVTKGNSSWRLQGVEGENTVNFAANGVSTDLSCNKSVNDEQWHHVAAVYDGTNIYMYVDGLLDATKPASGLINQNHDPVLLGANPESPNPYYFNGLVDEVTLYNRALSAQEIQNIYESGKSGKCQFSLTLSSQPQSSTNNLGDTVVFQVASTNEVPLTYQWFFDNNAIANATNNSLTIAGIQQTNFGSYFVEVSGSRSIVTSQVASLFEPATITSEPTNVVASYDSSATFNVAAVGYPAINFYQWSFNGTNLPGANSNSLTISRLGLQNTGNYQVLVSNAISSATSSVATLNMSPSIAIPFIGATPIWGQSATISVGAIGNGTLSYQWYFNGTPIAGATGPGINFPSIQFTNNGFYSVVISSPYGSVTNVAAQVAVDPAVVTLGFSPTLSINGAAGNSYLIQRSADLTNTNNWKNMTTITLFQQQQIWVDTSVDASSPFNNKYFYQLIPQY